ncbi:fatty acid desaturase family protein [Nocardia takedensis]
MAITDIKVYAHLTDTDVDLLGAEFDALRREIEEDRGAGDARYIRRAIAAQRALEISGRALVLVAGRRRPLRYAGIATLSLAKIVENMELGHNISHGQWDWMNDPEIHSSTWEWDMTATSAHWKHAHNYSHHVHTNIVGMDDDVGFGILRLTRDEPWTPKHLFQPAANVLLAASFEWGIALHDLKLTKRHLGVPRFEIASGPHREFARKAGRQLLKDYVLFPALSGRAWRKTLSANAIANVVRNVWAYLVIFCGHFPDGAEKFTARDLAGETRGEWYLRQLLGSANISGGPVLHFLTGNLSHQIEHHLFPDLPSNRYAEIAIRVREICDRYDLPYTTGSLGRQYFSAFRTIHKLALPDHWLRRTVHDAPETSSERRFADSRWSGTEITTAPAGSGGYVGLRTALRTARKRRVTVVDERLVRTAGSDASAFR